MKLSVSSYSFEQYTKEGKMTLIDCISKAKEMGFDAIEFITLPGDTFEEKKELAKKIKEEADKVGIEINAYTVGACLYYDTKEECEAEVEKLKNHLDIAKILGAKVMRHDVCAKLGKTGASRSFDLMLPTIAENARRVAEYGQTLGIKTCTENHGHVAQDSDRVERLFNAVNHDNFGLLVDMGNFLCVDENPITAVSRLAPYAIHAHAKDMVIRNKPFRIGGVMTRGGNYLSGAIVGEGDVPIEQCIRILKKAGYDDYLSLEYEARGDCIEGIAKGLRNLRQFLANIEEN